MVKHFLIGAVVAAASLVSLSAQAQQKRWWRRVSLTHFEST